MDRGILKDSQLNLDTFEAFESVIKSFIPELVNKDNEDYVLAASRYEQRNDFENASTAMVFGALANEDDAKHFAHQIDSSLFQRIYNLYIKDLDEAMIEIREIPQIDYDDKSGILDLYALKTAIKRYYTRISILNKSRIFRCLQ